MVYENRVSSKIHFKTRFYWIRSGFLKVGIIEKYGPTFDSLPYPWRFFVEIWHKKSEATPAVPDQFLVLQTLILASTLEKMPWNSVVKKGLRTYDTHNKAVWHKSICQMSLDKWISQVLSKVISTSFDQEDHLKDLVTLHSLDFTPYF